MRSWIVALIPCALLAQQVPPSPAELIARAIAAGKAQEARGHKYTYREDHIESQLDKTGKPGPPSSKTYDHIMLEGSEYTKLVLIEGKPLDAKTQKKVDADMEKARIERQKNRFLSLHRTVSMGPLDLLLRLFDNKVTGEETVRGRPTWRMESEPKPGHKAANKQEEEALATRRVYWFDREDGLIINDTSLFVRETNGFQPGSSISAEMIKIGDDWLAGNLTMLADLKFIAGMRAKTEAHQHYYDYKLFSVDSTLTVVPQ